MTESNGDEPRERLRQAGARHLTVVELLALLVGSRGSVGSAREVCERVVARAGGTLSRLGGLDVSEFESVPGVGRATACRFVAAFELGRRAASESVHPGVPVRGPADVFRRMGPRLRDLPQEEFHVLILDTRHRVVREVQITRGILNASLVHPREVFRPAVAEGAAGVILVHNHPSGDPTPSPEDRAATRQLGAAGRALGIPVLDHVVVGQGRYVSLSTELGGNI
jgi:DNA repair protein RadC